MKVGIDMNNDGVISDDEIVDLNKVKKRIILLWTLYGGAIATGCTLFII